MDNSRKYHLQAFTGEMKISTTSYPSSFNTKTAPFSPVKDESILFYFDVYHRESCEPENTGFGTSSNHYGMNNPAPSFTFGSPDPSRNSRSKFLLYLKQQPCSKPYPSIAYICVEVYYSDFSLLKSYCYQNGIAFDQTLCFAFEVVTHAVYSSPMKFSDHSVKMKKSDLTLKCKMYFNEETSSFPNLSYNFKSVYKSDMFSDFVIKVEDKSFPVHKVILVAHSPVLTKMLTQDFEESKTNSVTITDATPEVFEMFLKYLYCGEIEDKSWLSVKELYCLADKYDVGILKKDCVDIAIALLSIDLVCEILNFAYTYNESNLKATAKNFSVDRIKELISREDWKDLIAMHPMIGYEIIVHFVPK